MAENTEMNRKQFRILEALRATLASPMFGCIDDADIRKRLRQAEALVVHLLLELEDIPRIRQLSMQAYAALVPDIEEHLKRWRGTATTLDEFATLARSGDDRRFEACLQAARGLDAELRDIAPTQSIALRKRLMAVEADYCRQVLQAQDVVTSSPGDGPVSSDAGQTKTYDTDKLREFIAASFPAEAAVTIADSRFLSGGNSKYTLALCLDGVESLPQEVVLRADSALSTDMGGLSVTEEFRLLQALHARDVCVPTPLSIEPTGTVFGQPFMLVERRPGRMIGHMFDLPPSSAKICRESGAKLAAIHRVPLTDIGDWIRGANAAPSAQTASMLEQSLASWRALDTPSPVFDAAFAWLRDNVSIMDRTRGLVHGDYGLNNLLIDGERITAVLDWEFTHVGNPAYDLGYFYFQAEHMSSWEDFLAAYQSAGGVLPSQAELDYCIVFSATRLGVMVGQGGASFYTIPTLSLQLALVSARHMHETSVDRLSQVLERVL